MSLTRRRVPAAIGGAVLIGVVAGWWWWLQPRSTAATRGAALAADLGCLSCHGPGGTGGVPNPRSRDNEVPAWDGGVAMMYVESEDEIREWILDGAPRRLREADDWPPPGLVQMPADRGRIDERELLDLIAYFKAIAAFERWPEDGRVREGWLVARRHGCFGCHGAGGRLALPNPGSLKGVIPPWDGEDFAELVRDDAELEEWILDGDSARVREHPIARRFLERQLVSMPAYRDVLEEGELDAIVAYVRWLRRDLDDLRGALAEDGAQP